jgi:hypothetical protein
LLFGSGNAGGTVILVLGSGYGFKSWFVDGIASFRLNVGGAAGVGPVAGAVAGGS